MRCHAVRLLTIAGLSVALSAGAKHAQEEPKVGEKAPDFALEGTDGKTYRLSDFRGEKPVVLAWFPKADTPGCTRECRSFKQHGQALKGTGVAYFTASTDTPQDNKAFADKLELDYPILSDPTKQTARAYGVVHEGRAVPERWTFYIDKEGVIAHIDKGVQTRTEQAGEDVVAKLKELGLGAD